MSEFGVYNYTYCRVNWVINFNKMITWRTDQLNDLFHVRRTIDGWKYRVKDEMWTCFSLIEGDIVDGFYVDWLVEKELLSE